MFGLWHYLMDLCQVFIQTMPLGPKVAWSQVSPGTWPAFNRYLYITQVSDLCPLQTFDLHVDMKTLTEWMKPLLFPMVKPNVISHPYQLGQSISALRVEGCIFHFYSYFICIICKKRVDTLI